MLFIQRSKVNIIFFLMEFHLTPNMRSIKPIPPLHGPWILMTAGTLPAGLLHAQLLLLQGPSQAGVRRILQLA